MYVRRLWPRTCIHAVAVYNDEYIMKKNSAMYSILFLYFSLLCTIQGESEEPCFNYVEDTYMTCEIDPKVKYGNAAARILNGKQ